MRLKGTAFVCAVFALSVGVATAAGSNSTNAKLCYKNGWQTLYRTDGSPFANQDACVSYAAHGGTFVAATLTVVVVADTTDGTGNAAQDFAFSLSGGSSGQNFSLDDDNNTDATLPDNRSFNLPVGSFTVAQNGATPAGWTLLDVSCITDVNSSATTSLAGASATVTLGATAHPTCTFTYSQTG